MGLAIRYAIGAVGVLWFIPEVLALYEALYEFYLRVDKHPVAMSIVALVVILILRMLWKTPIDAKTRRSAQ